MDIKMLLRDYGTIIGPTFAFLLSVLALGVKFQFDHFAGRRTARRHLLHIQEMIRSTPPPPFEEPESSRRGMVSALEVRNAWALTVYHNRLLTVQSVLDALEPKVNEHGRAAVVARFHQVKWSFRNLLRYVEEARDTRLSADRSNVYGAIRSH